MMLSSGSVTLVTVDCMKPGAEFTIVEDTKVICEFKYLGVVCLPL